MSQLTSETCKNSAPRLTDDQVRQLLGHLPNWRVVSATGPLTREFKFKSFTDAVAFVNAIAALAESHNHHPDMLLRYNKVRVELSTHDVGGLSRNDFILAAHIDQLTHS